MARINNAKEYQAIMTRIDELFFETDEKTASNDSRLLELDLLSELVEEYEKEHGEILLPAKE
jgi:HTH-type transcriptional regulator/antitoxin HigA